jgi:catechol 2,3-dioxygenase-like lactoylglutathione lyase family enzyme
MTSVSRLGHVAIRVEDVDRAVGFYTGLGMRLVWKADDWCYLEAGEGRDGLALLGPGYKAAGPHFAFHFRNREEVDVVHDRLKADGVHVGAVHDHRDGTAIIHRLREESELPIAAYNVSGEYSMVKAAAERGWIDEKAVVLETLLSFKRAGADLILTYHACDAAAWLKET